MTDQGNILREIKNIVAGIEPDAKLILYGSYARNAAGEESDIDLLILINTDNPTWQDLKRITYPIYEYQYEIGQTISPFVISKRDWDLKYKFTDYYHNIAAEGIVL